MISQRLEISRASNAPGKVQTQLGLVRGKTRKGQRGYCSAMVLEKATSWTAPKCLQSVGSSIDPGGARVPICSMEVGTCTSLEVGSPGSAAQIGARICDLARAHPHGRGSGFRPRLLDSPFLVGRSSCRLKSLPLSCCKTATGSAKCRQDH
jgi:hypothetical protein